MSPHHLVFLNSWTLAPERGTGTAVAIAGLAGGLEGLGHRVTWIGPGSSPEVSGGITAGGRPVRLPGRLWFNLTLPRRLGAILARHRGHRETTRPVDAVVGFDLDGCFLPAPKGLPGARPLRVVALKGVAAEEREHERGLPGLSLGLLARLEGRSARRADRVVVTSEHCRQVAASAYGLAPERFAVVPEGLRWADWEVPPTEVEGTEPRRAPGEAVVLSVARQYPRKDTATLLAAFPAVLDAHPRTRLRIVGGGPELPALRARARALGLGEAVCFLGEVPGERAVRREYFQADVFCLPSRQEGFGIAFLEAMAAGLPVVGAAAGAVPEVVPEGEAGLLVPPRDPEALAAALIRLLGDAELRRRLGGAGRRRARGYDWSVVAERFLAAVGLTA